ncbi:YqaA family protein [Magnetococcus sp. PR-3]
MGLSSLFLLAFLAATILPLSSEVMLSAMIVAERWPAWALWGAATAGNVLGALVNWYLGRWLMHWQDHRWFPVSAQALERAKHRYDRYGVWSLLLAWVPIIGDPLTLVAGLFRTPLYLFIPLVLLGKGGRYGVILFLML